MKKQLLDYKTEFLDKFLKEFMEKFQKKFIENVLKKSFDKLIMKSHKEFQRKIPKSIPGRTFFGNFGKRKLQLVSIA